MNKKDELKQRIANLQEELDAFDRMPFNPITSITDKEKIEAFNKIYRLAADQYSFLKKEGIRMKDEDYYMWELATELTLGKEVFDKRSALETRER